MVNQGMRKPVAVVAFIALE
ncbi:hypothetical protein A2U01_0082683, partial [Trifolium medium]|nr:hypothetical protein [Trifolium medium]